MTRRHFLFAGGGALALAAAGAAGVGVRRALSMTTYDAAVASARTVLADHADVEDCIRFATLAPSGHNTQPWRFHISEGRVEIRPDFARRTPVVDPDDHHLFVSLGCAAENLSLASGARGRPGALTFDPADAGAVVFVVGEGVPSDPALVEAIPRRQSTRTPYDGRPVSAADLRVLAAASATPGVADPAFVRELRTWLRFSPREALATADGLFSATTGNPTLPSWLGRRVFDMVFRAEAENDKYARQLRASAGLAVSISTRPSS